MRRFFILLVCGAALANIVVAQSAVDRPEQVQKEKSKKAISKLQE
jgi:hypothetical protein